LAFVTQHNASTSCATRSADAVSITTRRRKNNDNVGSTRGQADKVARFALYDPRSFYSRLCTETSNALTRNDGRRLTDRRAWNSQETEYQLLGSNSFNCLWPDFGVELNQLQSKIADRCLAHAVQRIREARKNMRGAWFACSEISATERRRPHLPGFGVLIYH